MIVMGHGSWPIKTILSNANTHPLHTIDQHTKKAQKAKKNGV